MGRKQGTQQKILHFDEAGYNRELKELEKLRDDLNTLKEEIDELEPAPDVETIEQLHRIAMYGASEFKELYARQHGTFEFEGSVAVDKDQALQMIDWPNLSSVDAFSRSYEPKATPNGLTIEKGRVRLSRDAKTYIEGKHTLEVDDTVQAAKAEILERIRDDLQAAIDAGLFFGPPEDRLATLTKDAVRYIEKDKKVKLHPNFLRQLAAGRK